MEAIKKIDINGKSDYYYMCVGTHEMIWDYRDYKIDCDNALLKGQIAEEYSCFKEFILD